MLSVRRKPPRETKEREVVRFRSAAGENDFVRPNPQERGQPIARVIDCGPRFASGRMYAGGIAKVSFEIGLHRQPSGGGERRRRVMVEVDHSKVKALNR